jgi:hypothetical protein
MATLKNKLEGDDDKTTYKNKFYIVESNWFFRSSESVRLYHSPNFKLLQLSFNLTWKQQDTMNPEETQYGNVKIETIQIW